jgi:hypothetical protein
MAKYSASRGISAVFPRYSGISVGFPCRSHRGTVTKIPIAELTPDFQNFPLPREFKFRGISRGIPILDLALMSSNNVRSVLCYISISIFISLGS